MDIMTAIRIAGERGITRTAWERETVIFPTDKGDIGCEVFSVIFDKTHRTPFWSPLKEDLIADDWEVFM